MASNGVTAHFVNMPQFLASCSEAIVAIPITMAIALKAAGQPPLDELRSISPHVTGTLAGGYRVEASGMMAAIVNAVPYAAGAEYGSHGKWSGFNKYGAPPRLATRAIQDKAPEMQAIIQEAMKAPVSLNGWAH